MSRALRIVSLLALGLVLQGTASLTATRDETVRQVRKDLAAARDARNAGDLERAARAYGDALGRAEAGVGPRSFPVAQALDGLAEVQRELGRLGEAEATYARAIELWQRLLGPGQPRTALALHNLAGVQELLGHRQDARRTLERAVAVWSRSERRHSTDAAASLAALDRLSADHLTDTPSR